jgi:peptide/nickel transport system permease protein
MPGDPLKFIAGQDIIRLTDAQKEAIRVEHGLDKPLVAQYVKYIADTLKGDFGYSYRSKRPVFDLIGERLPWTLLLASVDLVLTAILGVALGAAAAWRRGKAKDIALNNAFIFLQSVPSFWIGMILLTVFGAKLGWFPLFGAKTIGRNYAGFAYAADILRHLALPAATLTIVSVSSIYFTMRYSMIDTLKEDYILMARMKGLDERRIKYRHAMRNAMIPVVTMIMLNLGFLVGGATITETVFSYPGMGRLLFESVTNRDYPLMQACFMIITLCVIAANALSDLAYPFLDPRITKRAAV